MCLTLSWTRIFCNWTTNLCACTTTLPINTFPTTSNSIDPFLQLTNLSLIITTSIPPTNVFDNPRFQWLELWQHHVNMKMFFLEHGKKPKLQNKSQTQNWIDNCIAQVHIRKHKLTHPNTCVCCNPKKDGCYLKK
jgi:hypothetical protein